MSFVCTVCNSDKSSEHPNVPPGRKYHAKGMLRLAASDNMIR